MPAETVSWDALPLLLSTEEASQVLRVHVNTVKALCRSGKLPAGKVGREWRINKSDLMKLTGATAMPVPVPVGHPGSFEYQGMLLENISDAVVATDEEHRITVWNHAAEEMFGWRAGEVLGRPIREVLRRDYRDITVEDHYRMLHAGERWRGRVMVWRRDGSTVEVETTALAVKDATGAVLMHIAVSRDVTEPVRAGARLSMLREIDLAVIAARSTREIAATSVERLREFIGCARASVLLFHPETNQAEFLAVNTGRGTRLPAEIRIPLEMLSIPPGFWRGEAHLVQDLKTEHGCDPITPALLAEGLQSHLSVPLVVEGTVIGSLNLAHTAPIFDTWVLETASEVASALASAVNNARLFEQIGASRRRMQSLSRRLVEVQEDERKRLSRVLHDDSGQLMAALQLRLARLKRDPTCSPSVHEQIGQIRRVADSVAESLRSLARDLRPFALDQDGLAPALKGYIESFQKQTGLKVELDVDAAAIGRLPGPVETALYRLVQEGLTNVARHAAANHVSLSLQREASCVVLELVDDGVGFDVDAALQGEQIGLLGMRERVDMLGGTLTIASRPRSASGQGGGTVIRLELPSERVAPPAQHSAVAATWNNRGVFSVGRAGRVVARAGIAVSSEFSRGGPSASLLEDPHIAAEDLHQPRPAVRDEGPAEEHIRRLDHELERRAGELQAVVDAIPDGLVVYDQARRIVAMNDAATTMLGYSAEQVASTLEEQCAVLRPQRPDGSPLPLDELPASRALNGEVVRDVEIILSTPARADHGLRVRVGSIPLRSSDGPVIGCVTTFTDIGPFHYASKLVSETIAQLRRANAELEAILSALPSGLIVYDPTGRITRMNDVALEMLGYREDTWQLPVAQRIGTAVIARNPDGSLCPGEEYAAMRALRGHVVRNQDLYIHLPEAPEKDFWGSFSGAPILAEDGQLAGAIVTMTDTGTLHELNERLAAALRSVEQREVALADANRQLQAQADELREATEQLERRVLERTEALEASREHLKSLSRRLVNLQERERRYVADQLYNEAGQVLAALKLYLNRDAEETACSPRLAEIQQLLDRVMQDLHHLATHLRPATLDRLGLISALRQYAEAWGQEHGIAVEFGSSGIARPALTGETETAVYRVVQEALMNTAAHARASRVVVDAQEMGCRLTVTVQDNGVGFDPVVSVASASTGLLGMQERVESVGGQLRVESTPGNGAKIVVEAPIGGGTTRQQQRDPGVDC